LVDPRPGRPEPELSESLPTNQFENNTGNFSKKILKKRIEWDNNGYKEIKENCMIVA
jgi:hypothetical protein